jgi:hypothetical protein
MYVDPPYPQNKCNYAHNMRGWEEHHALAEHLMASKAKWIYSSYDTPEIHALFDTTKCHIVKVQSASGLESKKGGGTRVLNREVLITNFEVPSLTMDFDDITAPSELTVERTEPRDGTTRNGHSTPSSLLQASLLDL